MLNQMRAGAGNFAAKVLLALLILSFALWGVGDMLGKSARNADVAVIGNVTISSSNYASTLAHEKDRVQKSLGANYTPELLATLNLPKMVLDRMVNRALLKQEATTLGLSPSDEDIKAMIATNPNFADDKGRFNKQAFLDTLRRNNMSEGAFIEQTRQELALNLLMRSMASLPAVPEIAIRTLQASLDEQRTATIYTLSPSSVMVSEPTAEDITAYHKQHAASFSTPEYRSVSYVTINNEDIQKAGKVSDDDLRKAYTERADEFKRPEHRNVDQLLYSIENDAKKATDMLKAGKSFEETAKATDAVNKKSLSLGDIEQDKVISEAADQVFALKTGEYTAPIKSAFGWHIFRVNKIIPASVSPFEDVRAQLEQDVEHIAADEALNKLSNQLMDTLASGVDIKQAAKELNLKAESLPAFNKNGETETGAKVKLPELDKFLETAFKVGEKTESSLMNSKGGTYYILRVETIVHERVKSLDEVKQAVVDGWKNEQRASKAAEMANKAAKKLTDSKERDAAISEFKLKMSGPVNVKRETPSDTLPEHMVMDLFNRARGEATAAHITKNGDYVIGVVKDITAAPLPAKEEASMAKLRESVSSSMTDELTQEYMEYLKQKYSVKVNEAVFKQITQNDNSN